MGTVTLSRATCRIVFCSWVITAAGYTACDGHTSNGVDGSLNSISEEVGPDASPPCLVIDTISHRIVGADDRREPWFGEIMGAALLPGRGIAVADRRRTRLHILSLDGEPVVLAGASGPGPQEFFNIRRIWAYRDHEWAISDGTASLRVSFWSATGAYVRAHNVPASRTSFSLLGPFADGQWAAAASGARVFSNNMPASENSLWIFRDAFDLLLLSDSFASDSSERGPWPELLDVTRYIGGVGGVMKIGLHPFMIRDQVVVGGDKLYILRDQGTVLDIYERQANRVAQIPLPITRRTVEWAAYFQHLETIAAAEHADPAAEDEISSAAVDRTRETRNAASVRRFSLTDC
jgi:hypothetical protein